VEQNSSRLFIGIIAAFFGAAFGIALYAKMGLFGIGAGIFALAFPFILFNTIHRILTGEWDPYLNPFNWQRR
jgi:hypothetical protein